MDGDTTVTTVTEVEVGRGPARDSVLLGKYRVESTLGFGGMGLVIKAHNLALDERVAIKLLRDDVELDEENVTRFVQEAKNAVKLKSEHVARIRDVGTMEDGRPYMVMELLEGLDLGKMLIEEGTLERSRAVDLVLQACDAIAEAHSLGIVHRDIKPTNLFVATRRDGSELLKVLDFGISKAQLGPDMSLTQTQSMLGTPAYMSPEQMRSARTVDRRSDIWSLGCVLYELVEGHAPFEAENFAELCVMVSLEPYTPMRLAPELEPVIERALAKSIETRYQDVADLAYALEPYASDPERAHRQIARIFRMLGRVHPEGRDSTPMPLGRGSHVRITHGAQPARAHTLPVPNVRSSPWKAVAFLALLTSLGIGAGLLMLGSGDDAGVAPAADSESEGESDSAGTVHEMTVERPDAAIAAAPDAAVAPIAPSTAAATPAPTKPKPAIKKLPPRRPSKPGATTVKPATTTTVPPAPMKPTPAKPKCDPFDNPKGC